MCLNSKVATTMIKYDADPNKGTDEYEMVNAEIIDLYSFTVNEGKYWISQRIAKNSSLFYLSFLNFAAVIDSNNKNKNSFIYSLSKRWKKFYKWRNEFSLRKME